MSADKRRNMLYGFAGVVIVLLAVIAYVSPRFRSEEASGAIGAVQKHRAPQIQQTDVVLGGESVKKEQKILYADYLTDAAALRNISADVAVAARSNEAKSRFEAVASQVGTRSVDLQQRYSLAARDYASSLESLSREVQANRASQLIGHVSADLQRMTNLSARDMAALNMRLAEAAQALEAEVQSLEARNADAMASRNADALASRNADALASRNADAMASRNADAMASRNADAMASRNADAMASRNADAMASRNADALASRNADALASRNADAMASRNADAMASRNADALASREALSVESHDVQFIEAAATQLAGIRSQAANAANLESFRQSVESMAQHFDARAAIHLEGRQEYMESLAQEALSLENAGAALSSLMARDMNAASRAEVLSNADKVASDLALRAEHLESASLVGMRDNLALQARAVDALGRFSQELQSMKHLDSRSESAAAFNRSVDALAQKMQSRAADLQASRAIAMREQLSAIDHHLQARQSFDSRISESLQNESALAMRLANRASYAAFAEQLASLSKGAENRSLASALQDAQAFSAEARALLNRAQDLQGARTK